MDVQAVLTCPKTKASTMYYKSKLQVHNCNCFNLGTKEAYCYPWEEHEGDLKCGSFRLHSVSTFCEDIDGPPNNKEANCVR